MLHLQFGKPLPFGLPSRDDRIAFARQLQVKQGQDELLAWAPQPKSKTLYTYAWLLRNAEKFMDMFTPVGDFEAAVVTMFGETRLYVRYVGNERLDVPTDSNIP